MLKFNFFNVAVLTIVALFLPLNSYCFDPRLNLNEICFVESLSIDADLMIFHQTKDALQLKLERQHYR